MSIRSACAALAALALAATLAGCMAHGDPEVPSSWLRVARTHGRDADGYGAWVALVAGGWRGTRVAGELIACDRDSLWLLASDGLVAVPTRGARNVKVFTGLDADGEARHVTMVRARPSDLVEWARIPQGIPAGLDRSLLRPQRRADPGR